MVVIESPARTQPKAAGSDGQARPSFAHVYEQQLDAIWRFLRSRVRDQHVAEDLTSEVFVRAWRAWDRFDHTRGRVEPWLWTIAHRTLVDHWRRNRPATTGIEDGDLLVDIDRLPEQDVLREELLQRLGVGLQQLEPRERDALAMRFAARMPHEDVARVLGLAPGASRMLVHRAIGRLRDHLDDITNAEVGDPADLERVIDDILERGTSAMGDGELQSLLVHLAVAHDAPTPAHLHDEVANCVQCAVGDGLDRAGGPSGTRTLDTPRGWKRASGAAFGLLLFVPVCLACTVTVASMVVGSLLGSLSLWVHELTLLTTPVILWIMARARRRHGGTTGWRVALAGALALGVHAGAHVILHTAERGSALIEQAWLGTAFVWTNRLGTALIVAGTALAWQEGRRWREREALLLSEITRNRAAEGLAPA